LEAINQLEEALAPYNEANGSTLKILRRRLSLWMSSSKVMGSAVYMRGELSLKYGGSQFWVSSDNRRIDCMLIKSRTG